MSKHIQCIKCDSLFTDEEIEGHNSCPNCKTKNIPLDLNNNVNIKINIQELRILCMWAENYAVTVDNKNLDDAYHESLVGTVDKIASKINKQLISINKGTSLTMTDEIKEVQKIYPKTDFYRDGKLEM